MLHILIEVSGMPKPGIVAQRSDLLTGDSGTGLARPTTTFRTYTPPGDGAHVVPHVLCDHPEGLPQTKCHELWLRSAAWDYFGSSSWAPKKKSTTSNQTWLPKKPSNLQCQNGFATLSPWAGHPRETHTQLLRKMCQGRSTPYIGDGKPPTFNRKSIKKMGI